MSLKVLPAAVCLASAPLLAQQPAPRALADEAAAILHVAAGEYALAVAGPGMVGDSLEYTETRLMLDQVRDRAAPLLRHSEHGRALAAALDSAEARMARVAEPAIFMRSIDRAHRVLADAWGAQLLPAPGRAPDPERGAELYVASCASCHGPEGGGDGAAATGMEPPPTDLTDATLAIESTPSRFFQVITYGIAGTAMVGWRDTLSQQDRWDLVAHLLHLPFTEEARRAGASLYAAACAGCHSPDDLTELEAQADLSGLDLRGLLRDGHGEMRSSGSIDEAEFRAIVAHVRTMFARGAGTGVGIEERIARVRAALDRALERRGTGAYAEAGRAAFDAYMAFEGIERELRVRAPALTRTMEHDFSRFRSEVSTPGGDPEVAYASLDENLSAAVGRLTDAPSRGSDFVGSLAIILREGLEAILIIGALLTFLVKSGNPEHRRSIYWGTAAAIGASVVTALAIELIFRVAPASQEALEGVTMLIAVAVLFSVSYWLVSKLEHKRWEAYIRGKMNRALSRGSQVALASVAFLAVYREGFETVLFYKALMSAAASTTPVVAGFVLGCAALIVLAVAIYRFGVRIPLRPFFAITSGLLYLMAFIFAGNGVRELQEAGLVAVTRLPGIPLVDVLGIYPTVETIAIQAVLLAALVGALGWTFVLRPALAGAAESG